MKLKPDCGGRWRTGWEDWADLGEQGISYGPDAERSKSQNSGCKRTVLAMGLVKARGSRGSPSSNMLMHLFSEHSVVLPARNGKPCARVQFFPGSEASSGATGLAFKKENTFYPMHREICLFLNGFQAGQAEESHLLTAEAVAAGTRAAHLLAHIRSSFCWLAQPKLPALGFL